MSDLLTRMTEALREALEWIGAGGKREDQAIDLCDRIDALLAEAAQPAIEPPLKSAKERYDEFMREAEEPSALERLRFFCSLAMNGQDWIDVEPFFDALATPQPASEPHEETDVDWEAIGWAYGKLMAAYSNTTRMDTALMLDRLKLMLAAAPTPKEKP